MFFKYKLKDVVRYSNEDIEYILVIKKREFNKTKRDYIYHKYYEGIGISLEKTREITKIRLIPKKDFENRVILKYIRERNLSNINTDEMNLDDFLGACA